MFIVEGIIVGLLAGAFMGGTSEILYSLGIFKASQLQVDGKFVTDKLKGESSEAKRYAFGIPIHLFTSVVFGVIYMGFTDVLDWDRESLGLIAAYLFVLWLSMLMVALPVAGQGFLGKNIGQYAWSEQFVTHLVYALVLWWGVHWV
jgi:uncharacterized membrane protein YagU involved in acid resistance